jgi:hypothetical protein
MNVAEKKRLTGRIAAEHIKLMAVPRPPAGAVDRLLALGDPTGIISDTMDELGIPCGAIGASVLRPTIAGKTIAGPTQHSAAHRSARRRAGARQPNGGIRSA